MMRMRISTVRYLRTLAEEFGGLRTTRGQALHRAAAHCIRMQEKLEQCRAIADRGDLDASAAAIYDAVRIRAPDESRALSVDYPLLTAEQQEYYRDLARAARGEPEYERPALLEEND